MKRIFLWIPFLLWAFLISYLSNQPGSSLPSTVFFSIQNIDKSFHFVEFAILTFFFIYAVENDLKNFSLQKRFGMVFLINSIYAFFDEIHQLIIPERFFDITDIISNISGIMFVLSICYGFGFRKFLVK